MMNSQKNSWISANRLMMMEGMVIHAHEPRTTGMSSTMFRQPGISTILSTLPAMILMMLSIGSVEATEDPNTTPAPDPDHSILKREQGEDAVKRPAGRSYTSRPLVAIGTIKEIDLQASRVVVIIDRKQSSLPRVLRINTEKTGQLDSILKREFPKERCFLIHEKTLGLDARLDMRTNQVRADTGKIHEDRQFLPLKSFGPGDRVSVLFRMTMTSDRPARVLTISKVNSGRQDFDADFRPTTNRIEYTQPADRTLDPDPNGAKGP